VRSRSGAPAVVRAAELHLLVVTGIAGLSPPTALSNRTGSNPKSSRLGKIQIFLATSYELQALLYNFDINSSELKPEHCNWITRTIGVHPPPSPGVDVTPQRTINMTWSLVGLASRTGSDALNWRLAKRRAEAVSTAIWLLDPGLLPDEIKFGVGRGVGSIRRPEGRSRR
jgi:hypothetical protein